MNILIIKTSALGDIIHCFPALAYIRAKFPHASIHWVAEKSSTSLIKAHPFVDSVIEVDTKGWRQLPSRKQKWNAFLGFRRNIQEHHYDIAFDFQGNIKSGIILSQVKAKKKVGFGFNTVPELPNIFATNRRYSPPKKRNIRQDYLFIVQKFCKDFTLNPDGKDLLFVKETENQFISTFLSTPPLHNRRTVMVCPGSMWKNKQMTATGLEMFLKAFVAKDENVSFIFVWGTEMEKNLLERYHRSFPENSVVLDRQNLSVLQRMMDRVDLVIAFDSLALHLCGTTNTPSFSIFGPSSAKKYRPIGEEHYHVQGACPYGQRFTKRCKKLRTCETGACIRKLPIDTVFTLFYTWYQKEFATEQVLVH